MSQSLRAENYQQGRILSLEAEVQRLGKVNERARQTVQSLRESLQDKDYRIRRLQARITRLANTILLIVILNLLAFALALSLLTEGR